MHGQVVRSKLVQYLFVIIDIIIFHETVIHVYFLNQGGTETRIT